MCQQWRYHHLGLTRVFDHALYCRTRACLLCMFVPPPTSLIKGVNSGFFHWALSVFIYFRFMSAFRIQFAGDVNQKISFVATVFSNTFAHCLHGLIHWSPNGPLQLSTFSIHNRLNVFLKQWVSIEHLDLNSNPMDSTQSSIITNKRQTVRQLGLKRDCQYNVFV